MSQVDDDIRCAIESYNAVYPGSKPRITLSRFSEGTVQLFLSEPDRPNVNRPHGQGDGKNIEEAAVALRKHLAKMLREVATKEADLLKFNTANITDFIERTQKSAEKLDPPAS
jgi:hypothetical protein